MWVSRISYDCEERFVYSVIWSIWFQQYLTNDQGPLCDIMWSDPDEEEEDWMMSPRGAGWVSGLLFFPFSEWSLLPEERSRRAGWVSHGLVLPPFLGQKFIHYRMRRVDEKMRTSTSWWSKGYCFSVGVFLFWFSCLGWFLKCGRFRFQWLAMIGSITKEVVLFYDAI